MNRIMKCLSQLPLILVVLALTLNFIGVAIWQEFTYTWMHVLVTDLKHNILQMWFMLSLFEILLAAIIFMIWVFGIKEKVIQKQWQKEKIIFNKLMNGQTCDQ